MNVTMVDRDSGATVQIREAAMRQRCGPCGGTIEPGDLIVAVSGSCAGWAHLLHLERMLLMADASGSIARSNALRQLEGAKPGDKVTLTGSILAALGVGATA